MREWMRWCRECRRMGISAALYGEGKFHGECKMVSHSLVIYSLVHFMSAQTVTSANYTCSKE